MAHLIVNLELTVTHELQIRLVPTFRLGQMEVRHPNELTEESAKEAADLMIAAYEWQERVQGYFFNSIRLPWIDSMTDSGESST